MSKLTKARLERIKKMEASVIQIGLDLAVARAGLEELQLAHYRQQAMGIGLYEMREITLSFSNNTVHGYYKGIEPYYNGVELTYYRKTKKGKPTKSLYRTVPSMLNHIEIGHN